MDISLIISILAFVFAVLGISIVNILQAIYGNPKLLIHNRNLLNLHLIYEIKNEPIHNTCLSKICRRSNAEVTNMRIFIDNALVDTSIEPFLDIVYGDDTNRLFNFNEKLVDKAILPPSEWFDYIISLRILVHKEGKIYIVDKDNQLSREIISGIYKLTLNMYINGVLMEFNDMFEISIRNDKPNVKWLRGETWEKVKEYKRDHAK